MDYYLFRIQQLERRITALEKALAAVKEPVTRIEGTGYTETIPAKHFVSVPMEMVPVEEAHTCPDCENLPKHKVCWEDASGMNRWED